MKTKIATTWGADDIVAIVDVGVTGWHPIAELRRHRQETLHVSTYGENA